MAGSMRDDFSASVKRQIAARAGHRCSNPTCRLLTNRPDPHHSDKSVNLGVAAHIRAASPGGPRYDGSTSPEERKSPDNAIWLCLPCSKVIDSSPDAFSVDGLLAWKRHAETAAVRDSRVTSDHTGALLVDMKAIRLEIIRFVGEWQVKDPGNVPYWQNIDPADNDAMTAAFNAHTQRTLENMWRMRAAFRSDILPFITSVAKAAEVILGEDNPDVAHLNHALSVPDTNHFSMLECETALGRVHDTLALR